ncbi:MAG: CBS domain-containing protein [Flavobacteriaceae bacterium]|nr:CBS domain-containing protein [Flavobacteriaceae bacterium]
MLITDIISRDFVPANMKSTVEKALQTIDGYRLSHIPVFEGLSFIGNLTEVHLNSRPMEEKLIESRPFLDYFFLTENSSIFDAVNGFYTHDANVIPVLDNSEKYLGIVVIEDVMSRLSSLPLLSEPAAMVTVKIPVKQYSMSEVTKIVESNNARIFGVFISDFQEDMVEITVKFNAESLTSVIETFERFGYLIKHKFFDDDRQDLFNERFNQLMKFLDV